MNNSLTDDHENRDISSTAEPPTQPDNSTLIDAPSWVTSWGYPTQQVDSLVRSNEKQEKGSKPSQKSNL
ncbi:hypothetical protein MTR_1g102730 [Medicago truncatula]|uniref:Uncharacterized protein n=1 Tax=Medicago truncatula TaxID=3880 RepID=A0A072VP24_MEDTR|nr:hypothetical protein MTR_1g102730 [Medicago truncatula]